MTGKPTEKMVFRLVHAGYSPDKIDAMDFEEASKIIGALKPYVKGTEKPVHKLDTAYAGFQAQEKEPARPYSKPSYNPASQYVSYCKDLYIAYMEKFNSEHAGKLMQPEQICELCIKIVNTFIKEFE